MVKLRILLLLLFCSINAQIALPTFQAFYTPPSSPETLTFNNSPTTNSWGHSFTENDISWTLTNGASVYTEQSYIADELDGDYLINFNSRIGDIRRSDGAEFALTSVVIQGDDRAGSTTTVQFRAYKNGTMVQDETRTLSNSEWVNQSFNWSDIDQFTWDPTNPTTSNVALDNLIYIP